MDHSHAHSMDTTGYSVLFTGSWQGEGWQGEGLEGQEGSHLALLRGTLCMCHTCSQTRATSSIGMRMGSRLLRSGPPKPEISRESDTSAVCRSLLSICIRSHSGFLFPRIFCKYTCTSKRNPTVASRPRASASPAVARGPWPDRPARLGLGAWAPGRCALTVERSELYGVRGGTPYGLPGYVRRCQIQMCHDEPGCLLSLSVAGGSSGVPALVVPVVALVVR